MYVLSVTKFAVVIYLKDLYIELFIDQGKSPFLLECDAFFLRKTFIANRGCILEKPKLKIYSLHSNWVPWVIFKSRAESNFSMPDSFYVFLIVYRNPLNFFKLLNSKLGKLRWIFVNFQGAFFWVSVAILEFFASLTI